MTSSIDDEWKMFLQDQCSNGFSSNLINTKQGGSLHSVQKKSSLASAAPPPNMPIFELKKNDFETSSAVLPENEDVNLSSPTLHSRKSLNNFDEDITKTNNDFLKKIEKDHYIVDCKEKIKPGITCKSLTKSKLRNLPEQDVKNINYSEGAFKTKNDLLNLTYSTNLLRSTTENTPSPPVLQTSKDVSIKGSPHKYFKIIEKKDFETFSRICETKCREDNTNYEAKHINGGTSSNVCKTKGYEEFFEKECGRNNIFDGCSTETKKKYISTSPILPLNDTTESLTSGLHLNEKINKVPKCDDLYISTKTKVLYFNRSIDIQDVFWKIPIIEYWKPEEGIIKKQIKIVCKTPEETEEYKNKIKNITYYREHIIKQVNNPTARVLKYKDERKITIGLNKKDIINLRGKIKNAFYNCFVIIVRFKYEGLFREIHVKVFNTGKMEIPGVFNKEHLQIVKKKLLALLEPLLLKNYQEQIVGEDQIDIVDEDKLKIIEPVKDENVLINSNFNCGFYIDRERLYNILTSKYGIECSFDPCSYPGVKCKYYFNNQNSFDKKEQTGQILNEDRKMKMSDLGDYKKYTEVSFMVFRTGSCLIVGNCSEQILRFIFQFLKDVLYKEFSYISIVNENSSTKEKKFKQKKKKILVTNSYLEHVRPIIIS
jgi:hypothetical protein